ncbi:glycosyltransferase [Acaryochloris sp. CCMEE 5410]|uniref:glycosyltransferase n=1 Tax=Acaryochloris sp. CCMEE 5410 TaxID=310037 RepID=UPI0002484C5E|nr:glycosyltransferase [Acaryochloris sp. CCMEE 5410]KAI9134457.1 glycosyltransferase [Acaryochloris sp. CCMEE 5410]
MVNILFVADKLALGNATIHGVTQLFSWWIPNFDPEKYQITLCTFREKDKAGEYLEDCGIKVIYFNRSKFSPAIFFDLIQTIKSHNIDILHLHGYGAWTYGRVASMLTRIPAVVHEHMVDEDMPPYFQFLDYLLSRWTERGIAISDAVAKFMEASRHVPSHLIDVIPNGVPLEKFREIEPHTNNSWKDQFSISNKHHLVGIVGRLHPIKGHKFFLDAASIVLKSYPNVSFLIVGDGDLRTELQEQAQSLGIADSVIFTGFRSDAFSIISEMDILVISSLSEGGPLTLFEAMAAGTAVIATNVIGLSHFVKPGESGYLIPSKDAEALANKILELLLDPELCNKMGHNAKAIISQHDNNRTVRLIEKCYEAVLQHS